MASKTFLDDSKLYINPYTGETIEPEPAAEITDAEFDELMELIVGISDTKVEKGGSGSGNFGHVGRPGEVGGSSGNGEGGYGKANAIRYRGKDIVKDVDPFTKGDIYRVEEPGFSGGTSFDTREDAVKYVDSMLSQQERASDETADTAKLRLNNFELEERNIRRIWQGKRTEEQIQSMLAEHRKILENDARKEFPFSTVDQALAFLEQKEKDIQDLEAKRNIVGNPIPVKEAQRGSRVTAKTVRDELRRWRNDPVLRKYALTEEEEAALLELEPVK